MALESDPDLPQAHNNLAVLYRKAGDLEKAISLYRTAAKLIPTESRIFWGLAQTLEASGNVTAALQAYKKAIVLRKDFAQAHFSLGNLLYDLGRFEKALHHFQQFVELWQGERRFTDYANKLIKAGKEKIERLEKNRGAKYAPLSP